MSYGGILNKSAYGGVSGAMSNCPTLQDVPITINSVSTVFRLNLFVINQLQMLINDGISSMHNSSVF